MLPEQLEIAANVAERVHDMAMYNAKRCDADDIAEYIASEIIDLVEWMSPDASLNRYIGSKIVDIYQFPKGTIVLIKQYFDLAY